MDRIGRFLVHDRAYSSYGDLENDTSEQPSVTNCLSIHQYNQNFQEKYRTVIEHRVDV
jgi:hypothetical protein